MRPRAPSSAIQARCGDAALCRAQEGATQHGTTCGDAIGCMALPPDRCKPAQRRNSKHMRSPGCRGAVNCRFWGCRIVGDRARPLTWDRRCLLQKRQALRMAADAPVGNARLLLLCAPKAKRQEWAQMRQQPRHAPRRLFFVDPKEKTNGMTAYRRIDPWRQSRIPERFQYFSPGPACSTFGPDLTSGAEWWPNLSDLTAGCGPGARVADSRTHGLTRATAASAGAAHRRQPSPCGDAA